MREEPRQVHYVHHLSYSLQERIVGLFLLCAPLLLIALFLFNSETRHLFEERVPYHLFLARASGVSTETAVKISGVEVGRVTAIDVAPDHRIHLTLGIRKRFTPLVRHDSLARVGKSALLGPAVVEVTAGSGARPEMPVGAELPVEEVGSFEDLAAGLAPVVEQAKETVARISALVAVVEPGQLSAMVADLAAAAGHLRRTTERVSTSELDRVAAILEGTRRAVAGVQRLIDRLQPAAGHLAEGSAGLPATAKEVHRLVLQLNALVGGLAVELRQFPQLMGEVKLLVEETDRLVHGAQRIWPLSGAIVPAGDLPLMPPVPANE